VLPGTAFPHASTAVTADTDLRGYTSGRLTARS
jgi:hypothetical protein